MRPRWRSQLPGSVVAAETAVGVPGATVATGPGPGTPSGDPLLEVRGVTVYHGQLRAVDGVDLSIGAGETYAIIGANGAGKSTLLRTIAGLHRPAEGRVHLEGRDITSETPERRLAAGIALVPEGRRLFHSMTVEENLLVGTYHARPGPFGLAEVYSLFPWMTARRRQRAVQLSGGEQQAVAIGRALLANPRVLLLDEVSLGLAPIVVRRIYEVLPTLVEGGVTVLLVEQDVGQARRVATRLQCLLEGRTSLVGHPDELTADEIERAYFGVGGRPAPARDDAEPGPQVAAGRTQAGPGASAVVEGASVVVEGAPAVVEGAHGGRTRPCSG